MRRLNAQGENARILYTDVPRGEVHMLHVSGSTLVSKDITVEVYGLTCRGWPQGLGMHQLAMFLHAQYHMRSRKSPPTSVLT